MLLEYLLICKENSRYLVLPFVKDIKLVSLTVGKQVNPCLSCDSWLAQGMHIHLHPFQRDNIYSVKFVKLFSFSDELCAFNLLIMHVYTWSRLHALCSINIHTIISYKKVLLFSIFWWNGNEWYLYLCWRNFFLNKNTILRWHITQSYKFPKIDL